LPITVGVGGHAIQQAAARQGADFRQIAVSMKNFMPALRFAAKAPVWTMPKFR
jgi:hypothetical protein